MYTITFKFLDSVKKTLPAALRVCTRSKKDMLSLQISKPKQHQDYKYSDISYSNEKVMILKYCDKNGISLLYSEDDS